MKPNGHQTLHKKPLKFVLFSGVQYKKYKIAGKKPGSGNTTNIGSIGSNKIKTFQEGNGVFKTMKEFEDYWRNY
ncbi:hypothetical protein KKA00_08990 [bacterium]|nr:hypothetical protein [bacterium]